MSGELVPANPGEFLFYQTDDGQTRIQVRVEGETVWLTQKQMADLFQTTKQNVSLHIQNIYEEGELIPAATVKQYLTVQTEGVRQVEREVDHYNLDVIISVGYHVKSLHAAEYQISFHQQSGEKRVDTGFPFRTPEVRIKGGSQPHARALRATSQCLFCARRPRPRIPCSAHGSDSHPTERVRGVS